MKNYINNHEPTNNVMTEVLWPCKPADQVCPSRLFCLP